MTANNGTRTLSLAKVHDFERTVVDETGITIGYEFSESEEKMLHYQNNPEEIGAAVEPEIVRCLSVTFQPFCKKLLVGDLSDRFRNIYELLAAIGFRTVEKWPECYLRIPTVSYAQAKLDELKIPIELREVNGIASHEEFLEVQLANFDRIVVLVSRDIEFYHDMTIHVLGVIKHLVVHIEDDQSPALKHKKELLLAKHGSYFAAFVFGAKLFAEAFEKAKRLEHGLPRDALMAHISALYDTYTSLHTSNQCIVDRITCLLTGVHAGECACFHVTGKYTGRVYKNIYFAPGFFEHLREAVHLIQGNN